MRQSPEHQVLIEDGIVHVYSQSSLAHPFNFLNVRIESFGVEGESLYGGEASLCTAINITL